MDITRLLIIGDSTCVLNLKTDHQLFQINRGRKIDSQVKKMQLYLFGHVMSDMTQSLHWGIIQVSTELLLLDWVACLLFSPLHPAKEHIMDLVAISSLYTCKIFLSKAMCNSTFGARDSCFLDEDQRASRYINYFFRVMKETLLPKGFVMKETLLPKWFVEAAGKPLQRPLLVHF